MIAQGKGGKIINTASMLSFQGGVFVPSYTASKSAIMDSQNFWPTSFLSSHKCQRIAPGYMRLITRRLCVLMKSEVRRYSQNTGRQMGCAGRFERGGGVFLASKAFDYITGYTVAVDGGWLSR
jgi:2-deoxy-D-gluconate 3-dehydrogenase